MTTARETVAIEQTVRIEAAPETVWSFWTDPVRMVEWWGSAAEIEAVPGGRVRVVMEPGGPVMLGAFVELDPPRRLVFTFGWEHNLPGEPLAPGSTQVEVTLMPEGDSTVLVLRHLDLPAIHATDHENGWAFFVGERLVAAAAAAAARTT